MIRSHEYQKMGTTISIDTVAQNWTKRLEADVSRRSGMPVKEARHVLARELGSPVTPAMLRNVSEGRIKSVNAWLLERLRVRIETQLKKEIKALEHELEIARLSNPDHCVTKIDEVENHINAARQTLAALSSR